MFIFKDFGNISKIFGRFNEFFRQIFKYFLVGFGRGVGQFWNLRKIYTPGGNWTSADVYKTISNASTLILLYISEVQAEVDLQRYKMCYSIHRNLHENVEVIFEDGRFFLFFFVGMQALYLGIGHRSLRFNLQNYFLVCHRKSTQIF